VIWQVSPPHAPPYCENWNPEPAVAVKVSAVPEAKLALQAEGQLIPAGLLVTVPVPVSANVSLKLGGGGGGGLLLLEAPPQPVSATIQARDTAKAGTLKLK
jgi:hypothetical protein